MQGSRPLTDAEVAQVLEVLGSPRNRALFLLGLRSGFRISELLSLRLKDVLQNGNLVDRVAVERKNMKGQLAGRTVVLHPEAREALGFWVNRLTERHTDPVTFLFRSRQGANQAMDRRSAWHLLTRAFAKCGLTGKLGTHCMRKTFAKKVHEKLGRDLVKTQKALGHARITSTVSYLSFNENDIDDAILKS